MHVNKIPDLWTKWIEVDAMMYAGKQPTVRALVLPKISRFSPERGRDFAHKARLFKQRRSATNGTLEAGAGSERGREIKGIYFNRLRICSRSGSESPQNPFLAFYQRWPGSSPNYTPFYQSLDISYFTER